jgi:endoglucanase
MTRVYPIPYSSLDTNEIQPMKPVVDYCLSKGMKVILDPHNYGFIYDSRTQIKREIGIDQQGTYLFKDFWSKMDATYRNYPNVLFGLMNEPHQQTAIEWYTGAIKAIKAIRDAGATQIILIPGTSWTGAHSWISSGNAKVWIGFKDDPLNNFVFEMHQYLDTDFSGTHSICTTNTSSTLIDATNWLSTNKFKGFLREIWLVYRSKLYK